MLGRCERLRTAIGARVNPAMPSGNEVFISAHANAVTDRRVRS